MIKRKNKFSTAGKLTLVNVSAKRTSGKHTLGNWEWLGKLSQLPNGSTYEELSCSMHMLVGRQYGKESKPDKL